MTISCSFFVITPDAEKFESGNDYANHDMQTDGISINSITDKGNNKLINLLTMLTVHFIFMEVSFGCL